MKSNFQILAPKGAKLAPLSIYPFGQVVQEEMSFKRFLNWCIGGPPVQLSGTFYAIVKEGIMGNTHVKLNEI